MYSLRLHGKVSFFDPEQIKRLATAREKNREKRLEKRGLFTENNRVFDLKNIELTEKRVNKADFLDRCQALINIQNKKQFNFLTFTLPSRQNGTYQAAPDCEKTGDLAVKANFSKLLEALTVKLKRDPAFKGFEFAYCWASEIQESRRAKFGGCGEIHFHMLSNIILKKDYF